MTNFSSLQQPRTLENSPNTPRYRPPNSQMPLRAGDSSEHPIEIGRCGSSDRKIRRNQQRVFQQNCPRTDSRQNSRNRPTKPHVVKLFVLANRSGRRHLETSRTLLGWGDDRLEKKLGCALIDITALGLGELNMTHRTLNQEKYTGRTGSSVGRNNVTGAGYH